MGANRYTQLDSATYNPMSFQEMMAAPAYMRKRHDESEAAIAAYETQLANVDSLDIHNDMALGRQKELYGELEGYANELSQNGFSNFNKSNLIKFNKKYQNEISPTGIIGQANAAKKQYDVEKSNYIANATKMGYSPEAAGDNWDKHSQAYSKGFDGKNITNIKSLYAPEYINAVDTATKLFKSAGLSETDISELNTSDIVTNDPKNPGSYILTTKGERIYQGNNKVQLQKALDYINGQVLNPESSTNKSIIHQGKDPNNVLNEISGLAGIYVRDKFIQDKGSEIKSGYRPPTKLTKPGEELGQPGVKTNLPHEAKEASAVTNNNTNMMSTILSVLNKENHPTTKLNISHDDTEEAKALIRKYNARAGKPISLNDLSEQNAIKYKSMFERLKYGDESLTNEKYDSEKAMEAVSQAMEKNKNILRQNFIITGDFVKTYGDRSIGTNTTSPQKIEDYVFRQRDYRKYSIDGKVVTYDELPAEMKESFQTNMKYAGYYSPKNFNTYINGKDKNRSLFVSPLVYKYTNQAGDVTEVLVSRSNDELNSPEYAADSVFNDIFTNTNILADVPYKLPNKNQYVSYNPKSKMYTIGAKDEKGFWKKPMYKTETELQNIIYDAFGVPTIKSKK